jgi:hypothetical protein
MSRRIKAGLTRTTRRHVLAGALGSGYALAVRPVSAETIATPAEDIEAGDVKIATMSGGAPTQSEGRRRLVWAADGR